MAKANMMNQTTKRIKNPQTIHLLEKDGRYRCNKAVGTTKEKSTKDETKITCKNCINRTIVTIQRKCVICGKKFDVELQGKIKKIKTKCFYSAGLTIGKTEYWECPRCCKDGRKEGKETKKTKVSANTKL